MLCIAAMQSIAREFRTSSVAELLTIPSYAIRDGRSLQEFCSRASRQNSQAERRQPLSPWRRDGDSNPEGVAALPLFESGSLPFGHPSDKPMVWCAGV